jgi:hypothetical protein
MLARTIAPSVVDARLSLVWFQRRRLSLEKRVQQPGDVRGSVIHVVDVCAGSYTELLSFLVAGGDDMGGLTFG